MKLDIYTKVMLGVLAMGAVYTLGVQLLVEVVT